MNFWEAMKAMEEGAKVTITEAEPGYFIYLNSDRQIVTSSGSWCRLSEHVVKREWIIVTDEVQKEKAVCLQSFG